MTSPESNGVICCSWTWWLDHQEHLPLPRQLIAALLPIPSLGSPLISARVEAFKRDGRDWFRDFLLPEALRVMLQAVSPLRGHDFRLAILDGRVKARSWGEEILHILQPWSPVRHLLPN